MAGSLTIGGTERGDQPAGSRKKLIATANNPLPICPQKSIFCRLKSSAGVLRRRRPADSPPNVRRRFSGNL